MRTVLTPLVTSLVLAAAVTFSAPASAGGSGSAATAEALFEEARARMAKGDYATACAKLEESEAIDASAGTEYNLALCYDKSGRTASAWATYLIAAASYHATNRPEWETRARDRAKTLVGSLSRVTLVLPPDAPAKLVVSRDGEKVGASALGTPIPVDPGHHVVEAIAPGRAPFHTTFDLAPGASTTIEVRLAAAEKSGERDRHDEHAAPAPAPAPTGQSHTLAIVLGGVGVAAVGVGALTGLLALEKDASSKNACPNSGVCADATARDDNRSASTFATVSTIGFIVGGTLLAASAIVWLLPSQGRASATRTRAFVAPTVALGGAGVVGAW